MKLCTYINQTIISAGSDKIPHIIAIRNNRIIGAFGSCVDKLLCEPSKRQCTIIGNDNLGEKLPNGTYTGTLGILQRKEADFYLKTEPDFISEPFLRKTIPLKTENVFFAQMILDGKNENKYYDILGILDFGWEIIFSYILSIFVVVIFCLFLSRLTITSENYNFHNNEKRNFASKLVYLTKNFIRKIDSTYKLFFLFAILFIYFTRLFISNCIKSNKVVVDVSYLIQNKHDLLNTEKIVCFLEHNSVMKMAELLPKHSLLSKLFYEKTYLSSKHVKEKKVLKNERCLFKRDIGMTEIIKDDFVLVGTQEEMYLYVLFFADFDKTMKVWLLEKGIQEFNSVIYYTVRFPTTESAASEFQNSYAESGLAQKLFQCIQRSVDLKLQKSIQVFRSIKEFMSDEVDFENLTISNFTLIFTIYFSIVILIFIAFFVKILSDRYLQDLKKLFPIINRNILNA